MTPSASAACPAVEVVFARGRLESPGVGILGNAFISALRSKTEQEHRRVRGAISRRQSGGRRRQRHERAYPIHDEQLPRHPPGAGRLFARRGGHRRRARAAVRLLRLQEPPAARARISTSPRSRCSATDRNGWGRSRTSIRSTSDRTIELCHGADPICNPADPDTWQDNWPAHLANAYIQAGMANQAADFVAGGERNR